MDGGPSVIRVELAMPHHQSSWIARQAIRSIYPTLLRRKVEP